MPNITTHCNRFSKVNMGQSAISRTHLHKTLLNPLYEHYQFMQLRLASCILLCVYARCKIFARPFYGRKIYISYIELKFIFNPYRITIYYIVYCFIIFWDISAIIYYYVLLHCLLIWLFHRNTRMGNLGAYANNGCL